MTMVTDDIQTLEARHVLQTYRRQPVTFVRGAGVRLYDADGHRVPRPAVGHWRRRTRLRTRRSHAGHHQSGADAAAHLEPVLSPASGSARLAPDDLVRPRGARSSATAAPKPTKRASSSPGATGTRSANAERKIIALEESFHGRTMGSLSVTSDEHYRAPFEPLLSGVKSISATKPQAVLDAVTKNTAAIILEPIQGEGGVRPLTPAFAAAVNDASQKTGALVIADEVQSGCGRTGYPFYSAAIGLKPHMMALGKALGAGVPVGAALVGSEVATKIMAGDHGTTYGGNLLACRAALTFVDELIGGGLLSHVGRIGQHFERRLNELKQKHACIKEVRGAGIMRGIELDRDAAAVVPAALKRGVVVNRTAENVIRLLPPYVIGEADLDEGLARLDQALADITA
ncbi:MAG: aminotransferase class III-fold pyridoxal phosphate-dependent enzyme [Vicinamibacterales bacterium]